MQTDKLQKLPAVCLAPFETLPKFDGQKFIRYKLTTLEELFRRLEPIYPRSPEGLACINFIKVGRLRPQLT